jgi:hypothetical protein
MIIKDKIDEMMRELDDYPKEAIKDKIDLYINTWSNCTKEEAVFLIGFEEGLKAVSRFL